MGHKFSLRVQTIGINLDIAIVIPRKSLYEIFYFFHVIGNFLCEWHSIAIFSFFLDVTCS